MKHYEVIGYTFDCNTYCSDCLSKGGAIFAGEADSWDRLSCNECGAQYKDGEWVPYECKRIKNGEGCFSYDCTPYACVNGY